MKPRISTVDDSIEQFAISRAFDMIEQMLGAESSRERMGIVQEALMELSSLLGTESGAGGFATPVAKKIEYGLGIFGNPQYVPSGTIYGETIYAHPTGLVIAFRSEQEMLCIACEGYQPIEVKIGSARLVEMGERFIVAGRQHNRCEE